MKDTLNKLKRILAPFKVSLIIVTLFALLASLFSVFGPKLLGDATTLIFDGIINKIVNNEAMDFTKLKSLLFVIFILYIISSIFSAVQGVLMSIVNQKITFNLRKQIAEKINKIPLSYYEEKETGDLLSIIINDVDVISESIDQSFTELIRSFVTIVGIIIVMFTINVTMSITVLLIYPLSILLIRYIIKSGQKYFVMQQENLAKVNGYVEETYSGQEVINLYDAKDKVKKEFEIKNHKLYKTGWISQYLSNILMPIMSFVSNLSYVIVSILGGYLTVKNKIQVGDILAFTQYIRQFNHPIRSTAQIAGVLQQLSAASTRVFDFLDEEEKTKDDYTKKKLLVNGNVEFNNVDFSYKKGEQVIKDFSVKIKEGQKVAIVGATGAGKTTIVKLLMRFYDVDKGSIKINNTNINDFRRNDLRKEIGMVLQDAWLLNDTILENIRFGCLDATDEKVKDVCILSRVDHFVRTLPEGYNTKINEESNNISMGQRQLLTIARVMLRDPKILILDEATSNVDTRTEILIQEALDELMKDKTSFIIAHRLSTIKGADLILVMEDGTIVEQGTHDQLLKKKGSYYKLYNSQFEDQ